MKRLYSLLGATLFLAASPVPAAAAQPDARITISHERNGVRVAYELVRPTTAYVIQLSGRSAPAANVRLDGSGLALADGQVKGTQSFRRFSLLLGPDAREVDSTYPLMLPVGEGAVVYAPHLMPASGTAEVRVAARGQRTKRLNSRAANGYLVLGRGGQDRGAFRAIVAPGAPTLLRETVLGRTGALLDFYTRRMKTRPEQRPTLVVSFSPPPAGAKANSFRGDVAPNGVVFLRVYSDEQGAADPASVGQYTSFLSHELFHLWNRSGDPDARGWWLHEGGAEYASWLAGAALWPTEGSLEKQLAGALQTCTMYLGEKPLGSLSDVEARSVRYPCGAVAHWLADAAARAYKPGNDAFDIWRRLYQRRKSAGAYTPADFEAAVAVAAPAALAPVGAILREPGVERWTTMAAALNAMGARVDVGEPPAFLLRLAAVRPLVLSACGEVWGVGENAGELFVQAPEGCATYGDSPILVKAQGISPMEDARGFYEAIRAACARRETVKIELKAKGARRVHAGKCTTAVTPPPPALTVVRAVLER